MTDPEGTDGFAVERLARLPGCFLCYRPVDGAPDVAPPPSASGEPITFGSFNNSAKLTEPVVRLWTKLLDAVPGSRLVIKSQQFKCEWLRRAYQDRFAAAGAGPERVEVLGR
jgi:predicted O-linked N-acetylglucosamine transferase (SPINDLY family)